MSVTFNQGVVGTLPPGKISRKRAAPYSDCNSGASANNGLAQVVDDLSVAAAAPARAHITASDAVITV